jgi:glycine dehydrogenase
MNLFEQQNTEFIRRHIGPTESETRHMLQVIGEPSLDALVDKTVPAGIRMKRCPFHPPSASMNTCN